MKTTKDFFRLLHVPGTIIQVGELNKVQPYNEDTIEEFLSQNEDKNLYFLGGVGHDCPGNHRASDKQIFQKNYVAFDLDIRKDLGGCSDEELEDAIQSVLENLKCNEFLSSYGAAVRSGNGLHLYYFSEAPVLLMGNEKAYSRGYDYFVNLIRTCNVVGNKPINVEADGACKNLGRIMRIPGSYNNKTGHIPVSFVLFTGNKSRVLEEIIYLGQSELKKEAGIQGVAAKTERPKLVLDIGEIAHLSFWDRLRRLDNKMMLEKLSGSKLVNGEKYEFKPRGGSGGWLIYLVGKDTPIDAWIDEKGYIGSPFINGTTWIDWLINYPSFKREAREVAHWAKEAFKIYVTEREISQFISKDAEEWFQDDLNPLPIAQSVFTWGVPLLDESFSPLKQGHFVVLVGESGSGKTTFSFHMAMQNALQGKNVCYLSLEMKAKAVVLSYVRNKLGISKARWRRQDFTSKEQLEALNIIKSTPKNLKIDEFDGHSVTMQDIQRKVDEGKVDLLFIDNLGFIDGEGEEWEMTREISRGLTKLAHDRGVTVVALHHFKKGVVGNTRGLRSLDGMRGSGKIRDDTDFVVQIMREPYDDPDIELTPEQKATSYVSMGKDREFGDLVTRKVYYRYGSFLSEFSNYENIPF